MLLSNNLQLDNYNTTRKKRRDKKINKQELWNLYDTEINGEKNKEIECLYSKTTTRDQNICEICSSNLELNEECFLTCSNPQCLSLIHI